MGTKLDTEQSSRAPWDMVVHFQGLGNIFNFGESFNSFPQSWIFLVCEHRSTSTIYINLFSIDTNPVYFFITDKLRLK